MSLSSEWPLLLFSCLYPICHSNLHNLPVQHLLDSLYVAMTTISEEDLTQIPTPANQWGCPLLDVGNSGEAGKLLCYRGWMYIANFLTHWCRVMHICVSKLIITGWENDLSPGRRQAIIWTNAGILLVWTLGTKSSKILSEIYTFSFRDAFENIVCEMAAILSWPQSVKDKCCGYESIQILISVRVQYPHDWR